MAMIFIMDEYKRFIHIINYAAIIFPFLFKIHRLNEKLSDYPNFEYMHKGHLIEQGARKQLTNLQMVLNLARSLSSILQPPCGQMSVCIPKLMIVGTFYDKIGLCSESLDEKNAILKDKLKPFQGIILRTQNGNIIHPVNTLVRPEENRQKFSEDLCQAILKGQGAYQTCKVPLSHLMFQFEILAYAESRNKEILLLEECYEIAKTVHINTREAVGEALIYLDSVGILFYFHEVLPNLVFVKPQVILKRLSDLVSLSFPGNDEVFHKEYTFALTEEDLHRLTTNGCFSKGALQALFPDQKDKLFTVDDFTELLKHLLVLAEIPCPNFTLYFLPCALPWEECTEEEIKAFIKPDIAPIILTWVLDSEHTRAIPYGIFVGTVNALLTQENNEAKFRIKSPSPIKNRRNAIFLECELKGILGYLLIVDKVFHVELLYKGHSACCPTLLDIVKGCIATAARKFHYHCNLGVVGEHFLSVCEAEQNEHSFKAYRGEDGRMFATCICHCNQIILSPSQAVWFPCKLNN